MSGNIHADPPVPRVLSYAAARALGLTPGQIEAHLKAGRWHRLGHEVLQTVPCRTDQIDRFALARLSHAQRAVAAAVRRPEGVITAQSAAVLQSLPLVSGVPSQVQLFVPGASWTGTRAGVRVREATLTPQQVRLVDPAMVRELPGGEPLADAGVRIVAPALTWVTVADDSDLADALAVGDHVLRHRLASRDELRVEAEAWASGTDALRLTRWLAYLNGRRESALESFAWSRFLQWGLPLPLMQCDVRDAQGFIGRVDFLWPDAGLIAEADGRMKYRVGLEVYREKLREDRIRAQGFDVIRFGWPDLTDPRELLRQRITTALERAA